MNANDIGREDNNTLELWIDIDVPRGSVGDGVYIVADPLDGYINVFNYGLAAPIVERSGCELWMHRRAHEEGQDGGRHRPRRHDEGPPTPRSQRARRGCHARPLGCQRRALEMREEASQVVPRCRGAGPCH